MPPPPSIPRSPRPVTLAASPAAPAQRPADRIASMTGFARVEGGTAAVRWTWEARSVNGRSLDVRLRLPPGYDRLEPAIRGRAGQCLKRGNVTVQLAVTRSGTATQLRVNRAVLDQILGLIRELSFAGAAPPRLDGLLSLRGVLEPVEEEAQEPEEVDAALERDLAAVLDSLAEARAGEGARLLPLLIGHLDRIQDLVADAAATAAIQPDALRERLRANVQALLDASPALSEDRLAQEAAILATKADVREELDRLSAHVKQARELLLGGGPVGRRLDFLCQEFNREANTLCSKATELALTRIGIDLKVVVDQLREQVQNIE